MVRQADNDRLLISGWVYVEEKQISLVFISQ